VAAGIAVRRLSDGRSRRNLHGKATWNINLGRDEAKIKDGRRGKEFASHMEGERRTTTGAPTVQKIMVSRKGATGLNRDGRHCDGARRRASMGLSCGMVII
jgi:hypothetical protein